MKEGLKFYSLTTHEIHKFVANYCRIILLISVNHTIWLALGFNEYYGFKGGSGVKATNAHPISWRTDSRQLFIGGSPPRSVNVGFLP